MSKSTKISFRFRPSKDNDILRLKELSDLNGYVFGNIVSIAINSVFSKGEKILIAKVNPNNIVSKNGAEVSIYLNEADICLLKEYSAVSKKNNTTLIRTALKSSIDIVYENEESIISEADITKKTIAQITRFVPQIAANEEIKPAIKVVDNNRINNDENVPEIVEEIPAKTIDTTIDTTKPIVNNSDNEEEKLHDYLFLNTNWM